MKTTSSNDGELLNRNGSGMNFNISYKSFFINNKDVVSLMFWKIFIEHSSDKEKEKLIT